MIHRHAALTAVPLFLLGLVLGPCQSGACAEDVVIAGKVAARISCPGGFADTSQRAADIDRRIGDAISIEDVGSPKMRVADRNGNPAVFVGKTYILTAYPQDARPYKLSPQQLAKSWATQIGRLLPLAEPSIHMGNPLAGSELAREQARAAASASISVPSQRWAITDIVLADIARARALSEADYASQRTAIVGGINKVVVGYLTRERTGGASLVTPPHKPGCCPQPGGCPACQAAMKSAGEAAAEAAPRSVPGAMARRIVGGLKLMRAVDEPRYKRDRAMVAYTIIRTIEKSLPAGPLASAG